MAVLDDTLPSRFAPNTPVEVLLKRMMIESWFSSINYNAFYTSCHPVHCTFAYDSRHNVPYLITTIIGIFGGLDIILEFVYLIVGRFLFRCGKARQPNNTSLSRNPEALNRK
ncbi:unnamed protein product [Rotaria sp. Silwood2]|nr:unnamed protein product [Rotaria sp. Silwood2]CAF4381331.1 unnamed protein product [Rotaria sp. Silwood2]